jgi:hypothetical protein
VRRWLAVINHSRMSGKPPQAAEIDWHGDLQKYLVPESEVIQITIYRSAVRGGVPSRDGDRRSHDPGQR